MSISRQTIVRPALLGLFAATLAVAGLAGNAVVAPTETRADQCNPGGVFGSDANSPLCLILPFCYEYYILTPNTICVSGQGVTNG